MKEYNYLFLFIFFFIQLVNGSVFSLTKEGNLVVEPIGNGKLNLNPSLSINNVDVMQELNQMTSISLEAKNLDLFNLNLFASEGITGFTNSATGFRQFYSADFFQNGSDVYLFLGGRTSTPTPACCPRPSEIYKWSPTLESFQPSVTLNINDGDQTLVWTPFKMYGRNFFLRGIVQSSSSSIYEYTNAASQLTLIQSLQAGTINNRVPSFNFCDFGNERFIIESIRNSTEQKIYSEGSPLFNGNPSLLFVAPVGGGFVGSEQSKCFQHGGNNYVVFSLDGQLQIHQRISSWNIVSNTSYSDAIASATPRYINTITINSQVYLIFCANAGSVRIFKFNGGTKTFNFLQTVLNEGVNYNPPQVFQIGSKAYFAVSNSIASSGTSTWHLFRLNEQLDLFERIYQFTGPNNVNLAATGVEIIDNKVWILPFGYTVGTPSANPTLTLHVV